MDGYANANDISAVVAADKAHVWHHLIQHKPYEQSNQTPRIIVHGSGMRIRDAMGKEYIDAVSGGVWTVNVGYGRQRIADAVSQQLVEMVDDLLPPEERPAITVRALPAKGGKRRKSSRELFGADHGPSPYLDG